MIDLNAVTAVRSPLALVYAFEINSRGEIVGQGQTSNGQLHAFLATPEDVDLARVRDGRASQRANRQKRHVALPAQARMQLWQRLRFTRR